MRHSRHLKKGAFLRCYAEIGNVSLAAMQAGIHRATHYRWLAEDEAYANAAEEAKEEAIEALEAEARRRALEYSDTLLMFLLKAARPDKYRERREITGAGRGPLMVVSAPPSKRAPVKTVRELINPLPAQRRYLNSV